MEIHNAKNPKISMVVAMSLNRIIGKNGKLPWNLPEELAIFTRLTMGHCVIVGRKTYECIGRPLEGRTTIVVSRQENLRIPGCEVVHSLIEGVNLAKQKGDNEIFIAGGESLFGEGEKLADTIYLSTIQAEIEGDTTMPVFSKELWKAKEKKVYENIPGHKYSWIFEKLERD